MIDFPEWGAGTGAFRLADEVARFQAVVAVQNEMSTVVADLPTLMTLVATRAQGVSTMGSPLAGSTEELIGDADRALYAAKSRGRNCSVLGADLAPPDLFSNALPAA